MPYPLALPGTLVFALSLQAATVTWNVDANGDWTNNGNWTANNPNSADDVAQFHNVITAARAVNLNSNRTVGTLSFDSGQNYTLSGSSTLTLDVSSGNSAITIGNSNGNGAHTISAAISLKDNLTLTQNSTALLTISGNIGRSGSAKDITKAGTGTVLLSGNNSYFGTLTISAGTVRVGSTTAIDSDVVVQSGGTLDLNGVSVGKQFTLNGSGASGTGGALVNSNGTAATVSNAGSFSGNATVAATGGNITLSANWDTNTHAITFDGSQTITVSGNLYDSGSITKAGSGTLVLSGNNSYSGTTTVSAGTLRLGHTSGLGTTGSGTTVSSGATLDLNGLAIGAENLTLSGTGVGGNGALVNTSGTAASHSGAVSLSAHSSIGGSGDLTLSGAISGASNLTKVGAGKLTVSAFDTHSGTTLIEDGTLIINGSLSSTSSVTVNSDSNVDGGTLGGTGTVAAATTVNSSGAIAPGSGNTGSGGIGTLAIDGNLTFSSGSNYQWQVGASQTADLINLIDDLVIASGWSLTVFDGAGIDSAVKTDQFNLFNFSGSLTIGGVSRSGTGYLTAGTDYTLNLSNLSAAHQEAVNQAVLYYDVPGGRVYLTNIPLPAPLAGGLAGLIGLIVLTRQRRVAVKLASGRTLA